MSEASGPQLYVSAMRESSDKGEYHEFDVTLGTLECVVRMNCALADLEYVFVFFHGFAASPELCLGVSEKFFASQRGRCVFVFPRAPFRINDGDFGGVPMTIFGNFKWWDIAYETPWQWMRKRWKGADVGEGSNGGSGCRRCSATSSSATASTAGSAEPPSSRNDEDECSCSTNADNFNSGPIGTGLRGTRRHSFSRPTLPPSWRDKIAQSGASSESNSQKVSDSVQRKSREKRPPCFRWSGADVPAKLPSVRRAILQMLADLQALLSVEPRQIVLSGFSQGGALALDVALLMDPCPLAVGMFSACPMCRQEWPTRIRSRPVMQREMLVFQAHGTLDAVVPPVAARWLARFLSGAKFQRFRFRTFEGGHRLDDRATVEFFRRVADLAVSQTPATPPVRRGFTYSFLAIRPMTVADRVPTFQQPFRGTPSNVDGHATLETLPRQMMPLPPPQFPRIENALYDATYRMSACCLPWLF
eukprot:Polyplicarium_translucidae@DN2056_c0_g1_i2.p1